VIFSTSRFNIGLGLSVIDSPTPIREGSLCDGAIIKECQKCFAKFWHHVSKDMMQVNPNVYNIINFQDFQKEF
jgi:hypothetical protein